MFFKIRLLPARNAFTLVVVAASSNIKGHGGSRGHRGKSLDHGGLHRGGRGDGALWAFNVDIGLSWDLLMNIRKGLRVSLTILIKASRGGHGNGGSVESRGKRGHHGGCDGGGGDGVAGSSGVPGSSELGLGGLHLGGVGDVEGVGVAGNGQGSEDDLNF